MTACSSPVGIASVISSEATTPPKRLVRPSIASSASVTARSFQEPIDAAARKQHHQEKQRPEHDRPIFRDLHRDRRGHARETQQAEGWGGGITKHPQGAPPHPPAGTASPARHAGPPDRDTAT